MDKLVLMIVCVVISVEGAFAAPKQRVVPKLETKPLITQNLPANWTEIRAEIADNFSCDGKTYGYYADVDNDCQVFHVCLPLQGRNSTFKWSFICPSETIFNQESFTCTRTEDSIKCEEAPDFYKLNDNFGQIEEKDDDKKGKKKKDKREEGEKEEQSSNTDERRGKTEKDQPYGKRRS